MDISRHRTLAEVTVGESHTWVVGVGVEVEFNAQPEGPTV